MTEKIYSKQDALRILENMKSDDEYNDMEFDWFMNEKLYGISDQMAEYALKATPVEIVEEFIKHYYI